MTTHDRAEIADLLARLVLALDDRRFDDLRSIYAADAHTSSPRGELHGIDEILALVRRNASGEELTQHVNGSTVIDVEGDRAEVRSHQLVHYFRAGAAPHRTTGIHFRYTAERRPEGWRLSRGLITPLWQNPTPAR